MKKVICVFLLVFLYSCAKETTLPIDTNIWGYEFNERQLSGAFAAMRNTTESEKGIYMMVPIQLDDGGETNILGYVDKESGIFSIVDSNATTNCSIDLPEACSSHISDKYYFINYYNDHLYFVEDAINIDTGATTVQLVQMDLDGTNRKTVVKLSDSAPKVSKFSILFHQGFVFYSFGDYSVNKIDMSTWENSEMVNFSSSSGINLIQAESNLLYITVDVYNNEETKRANALLAYDLSNDKLTLSEISLPLYQFQEEAYVYYETIDDSMYLFNSTTDESIKLKQYTGSVLFDDEYIIIKDYSSSDQNDLYLYNKQGVLLDTYKQEEALAMAGFAQLISNGYYYTYIYYEDKTAFVRISYKGGKFNDLEILESWDGSRYSGG